MSPRRRAPKAIRDRRKASAERPPLPVAFNVHDEKVARQALERAKAEHLAYHGPGLTFGELAIGECFDWAPPLPRGPRPLVKTSDTRYEFERDPGEVGGYGTAAAYYRVERWS